MTEFSTVARPTNRKARTLFFTLLLICAALFVASMLKVPYKGIIQLGAVVFLVAAVSVYTRYVSPVYSYEITRDSADTPIFVVTSAAGKRSTTLARVDLADIRSAERIDAAARAAYRVPAGVRKYNYVPTLRPESCVCLTLSHLGEQSVIFIECSDEYRDMLLRFAKEARELLAASDED